MTISYGARVRYPSATDVERITTEVINQAPALAPKLQTITASYIASEIKRRLCNEICVEVDLVVTGTTIGGSSPSAAPRCSGGAPMPLLFQGVPPYGFGSLLQS